MIEAWYDRQIDVPLLLVEAPFRDLGAPLLEEVHKHTERGDTVVTVVLPELVPRALVGERAAQPDGAVLQAPAAVRTQRRGHQRAVPSADAGDVVTAACARPTGGLVGCRAPCRQTAIHRALSGGLTKRLLVGRACPSDRLEHTLLPKVLALPVFSSDALSSVAYATEEILLVLLQRQHRRGGNLTFPIAIAVSTLMVDRDPVVPPDGAGLSQSGGGAYIVSKENLGEVAGPGRPPRRCWSTTCSRWWSRRGRRGRDHLGDPVAVRAPGGAGDRVRHARHAREPARREGSRRPCSRSRPTGSSSSCSSWR